MAKVNYVVHSYPSQILTWEAEAERMGRALQDPKKIGKKSWWVVRVLNAAASGAFRVRFTERQITRGRISPDEELTQFQFRAERYEIQAWTEAAAEADLERSEWCRQVLDAACTHDVSHLWAAA